MNTQESDLLQRVNCEFPCGFYKIFSFKKIEVFNGLKIMCKSRGESEKGLSVYK